MPKESAKALRLMAQNDIDAAVEIAKEIRDELHLDEAADIDMVLPLCKEVQARVQAVANRVSTLADIPPKITEEVDID